MKARTAGITTPIEWMLGYDNVVKDLDKRPMVKESPLYEKPALDFDPDKHRIW